MKHFARVKNNKVIQYPYLAKEPDIENGIFPVVIEKPTIFRDEDEVWLANEYSIYPEFVLVKMTKRDKNQQEIDHGEAKKQAEKEREKIRIKETIDIVIENIKSDKYTKDQLSELLTTIRSRT